MSGRDFKKKPRAKFKALGKLTKKEAREEAAALREGIEYHNNLYFVKKSCFATNKQKETPCLFSNFLLKITAKKT